MESQNMKTNGKIDEWKEEPEYIEIDIPYNLFQLLRSDNYDIQNICRICMSTNNNVLYSMISDNGDNILANMLTTLTAVQVSPSDGLPPNMCESCQTLLVQYYEFKVKCEKSDYTLRSVLRGGFMPKEEPTDNNVIIKADNVTDNKDRIEIKEETEYNTDIKYSQNHCKNGNIDETLGLMEDTGIKRKKIQKGDVTINDQNKTEIKEEDDPSYRDVQYLDPSDDADNDENQLQIQYKGRKPKKKMKPVTNAHKIFEDNLPLGKKRKGRKRSKRYKCNLCPKVFFEVKSLNIHIKSQHGIEAKEQAYSCVDCKSSFDTEHDLIVHSALHPVGTNWNCNQCDKEFNSKATLHRHIQRHMKSKPYCCETCGKTFTELCALRRHIRVHTGEHVEKKHVCHICQKRYHSSSLLTAHMSRHIDLRPYECDTCGKCFLSERLLRSHMLVHTDCKQYACSYCDKRFRHESTRNTHHRTHTGEKPYVCSVCGKTFIQNSNLTLHMRSHTGERPYSCKMCDRKFSSGSTLKTHERIHTGERPYSCKVCGKTFARFNRRLHMRQHTGERPFACASCPKKFVSASRLRDHCRIHTGEKPYECSQCMSMFSTRSHLVKHIKTHEQTKKKAQKQELVIIKKVPIKQNTMENINKGNEEMEKLNKISDPVKNIDKNITIGLFEEVPLEVNKEFILQEDGQGLDVEKCENNYQINSDVCLNTSNIPNSDGNCISDVNLVTVNEGVSISASTLEGSTVKLYQLDQSLVQIQSSNSQVTISKITSKMTTNF